MTFIPNDSFFLRIAQGLVPKHSILNKFGRNDNVAAAGEDVWMGGGVYTGQPSNTPETVDFSSSSPSDTSLGSGMQTLRFWGLKTATSTVIESEDITLSGATLVTSAVTWYRVFRVKGLTYGAGATNAGIISAHQTTTTANIFATVAIGKGQTQVCAFTVPYQTTGYLVGRNVTMVRSNNQAGSSEISVRIRETGSGGYQAGFNDEITNSVGSSGLLATPTTLPALADVILRAESTSNAGTIVTGTLNVILIQD